MESEISQDFEAVPKVTERLNYLFARKLPYHRQVESAECGLACISMIASFHGHKTNLISLRKQFPISEKGMKISDLVEISACLDLTARPIRLELDELGALTLPCILHWNLNHFVVLKKVGRRNAVIHDPAKGIRRYSFQEISKCFTGVALELRPTPGFKRKVTYERIHLRQMMGKVFGLKRSMFQIALFAFAIEIFSLITPFFSQWMIDQAVVSADLNLLIILAFGFGLLTITNVLVDTARSWAVMVMGTNLNVQWLANLFSHLMKLPISYFQKRQLGDVISRFNTINTIQNSLTTSIVAASMDGLMSIGTLVAMLIYSPFLSIFTVASIFIYMILRTAFYAALLSSTESSIAYDAKQQTIFLETLRGIQSIKLFSKEKERTTLWLNTIIDQKNASLRVQRLNILFQSAFKLLSGVEGVIVLSVGAGMVISKSFSVGMLMAYISYKSQFSDRVSNLVDRAFEWKMLKLQTIRLADIALSEPEVDNNAYAFELKSVEPTIEVSNVWFSYGLGDKAVVRNVSFKVDSGESVAIIGPSGCGKTTLLKLMLGLYQPNHGDIKIGGISLSKIGKSNYRKMIGTVMQEDTLYAGTVAENISFFSADTEMKWVESCAKMACIHNEIISMPMGYNTLIGDMGTGFSGGQKQRLLLARALYCRPKILFLDEATSHLDLPNERNVTEIIKSLKLTRVIIAHRQETIAGADRVISLATENETTQLA